MENSAGVEKVMGGVKNGMQRYIALKSDYYYDCKSNRIVYSKKHLSQIIDSNACKFLPPYENDYLENNIYSNQQQLILSVTEHCNFRCEYCTYYDSKFENEKKLKHMTFDVAQMAIDNYIAHSHLAEVRCISFYGGEPLMNIHLIKQCVEYVEKLSLNKKMRFLITINGTLLTEETAKYLTDKRFMVNISLDGPLYIHNQYRKDREQNDTFFNVIEAAKTLIILDPDYWARELRFLCVLTPPKNVRAILDFFESMPYGYRVSDVIITNHIKECISQQKHTNISAEDVEVDLKMYKRYTLEVSLEIQRTKDVLKRSFFERNVFSVGANCLPLVRRLYVSVEGNYYICEKYDENIINSFGNVNSGIDFPKLSQLRQDTLNFHNENCKTCWAIRFCGICFATINRYPDCCEDYKNQALNNLINILEVENG